MQLDHVAILVADIEATVDAWSLPDAQEIETFPREGTRELYCGAAGRSGRVLLMQPIGPGPYERAMAKRGPGLHHVALRVHDRGSQNLDRGRWSVVERPGVARPRRGFTFRPGAMTLRASACGSFTPRGFRLSAL